MNEFLRELGPAGAPVRELSVYRTTILLGNSIVLGLVLMLLTWWVSSILDQGRRRRGDEKEESDEVMGASNVLFLCLGMTAVMILVNNNLARAFAIGAAIALVRFRVKMEGKFLGISLLYGVLAGMACGVDRIDVAWGVTLMFSLLLVLVLGIRRLSIKRG